MDGGLNNNFLRPKVPGIWSTGDFQNEKKLIDIILKFPGILTDGYASSPVQGLPYGFKNRGEFWVYVKKELGLPKLLSEDYSQKFRNMKKTYYSCVSGGRVYKYHAQFMAILGLRMNFERIDERVGERLNL